MSLFLLVRVFIGGDVLVQATPGLISVLICPIVFMLSPRPLMTSSPVCLIGEIQVLIVLLFIRGRVDTSCHLHASVHLVEIKDMLVRSLHGGLLLCKLPHLRERPVNYKPFKGILDAFFSLVCRRVSGALVSLVDCSSPLILDNYDRIVKLNKVVIYILLFLGDGLTLPILDHVIDDAIKVVVFDLILLKIQFLLFDQLRFALQCLLIIEALVL